MFREDFLAVVKAAEARVKFIQSNLIGFFIGSMLAGIFVGLGICLIFTEGGLLVGLPYGKIVMGASFGIALSLVIIAGAELFTGLNFIMTTGALEKKVSWSNVLKIWIVCYIGNLIGSILLGSLFVGAGLATGNVGEFIATTSETKMNIPIINLFLRALLCNLLVCLAVWCNFRCKSESGKLIMIFWCLFAFITTGFEHSVANMTLLTIGLLEPFGRDVTLTGYCYNLLVVTLGNMVGGILFVAFPYYMIGKDKEV